MTSVGQNILGYTAQEFSRNVKYYTGIFGLELIAGGFILMFSILGLFSIFNIFKTDKKITNLKFIHIGKCGGTSIIYYFLKNGINFSTGFFFITLLSTSTTSNLFFCSA